MQNIENRLKFQSLRSNQVADRMVFKVDFKGTLKKMI